MAEMLGCSPDYFLLVKDRFTRSVVTDLPHTSIRWSRVLDDVSEAIVTVPGGCCSKIAKVEPWRHELTILRSGDVVWEGPILVPGSCRDTVTLNARDVLQWAARRVIHERHCWAVSCGGRPISPVAAARELLRDALSPDDPDVLPHLVTADTGARIALDYRANSAYVLDTLKDLARGSLDFTAVGRRIVLMPEGHALGRTALLTCDSFEGDVCVSTNGLATATRTVVAGQGVVGSAGGTSSYYGLIEVLIKDDAIRTAASARAHAAGALRGAIPPPTRVQPGSGAFLNPTAPVPISDLVPGVVVPVIADCVCRSVDETLRLTKLDVTVDADGEKVAPTLAPPGVEPGEENIGGGGS